MRILLNDTGHFQEVSAGNMRRLCVLTKHIMASVARAAAPRFKKNSKRIGALGQKIGMTTMYDSYGWLHPVTIVRVSVSSIVCLLTQRRLPNVRS